MKPDWKDAPEWASWLAQDKSGEWVWHEYKPYYKSNEGIWLSDRSWEYARRAEHVVPETTLECRP